MATISTKKRYCAVGKICNVGFSSFHSKQLHAILWLGCFIVLFTCLLFSFSCSNDSSDQSNIEEPPGGEESSTVDSVKNEAPYTYYEFDGIYIFYETDELETYRNLLPNVFDMPDTPLLWAYVIDFYKMDQATEPYKEAAVFLFAKYEGKPIWHCITMPVTSDEARVLGIYNLGYPKIMGDISLTRNNKRYTGTLQLNGEKILTLSVDTNEHSITPEEKEMFEKIKNIPNLNLRNGEIFEPKFGNSDGQYTLLEISEMYPDQFIIEVGTPELNLDQQAAAAYSYKLGDLFGMTPTKTVLAYYFKNKFVMRFEN